MTQQEILSVVTGRTEKELEYRNKTNLISPSECYEAMTKWAEQIWKEACEEQCEACRETCQDLLYNDDEPEGWPRKIGKTNNVEFPY